MTSWQDITEAVGGALVLCWGVYVEWRLRQAQDATTLLKRQYEDKTIEDDVHSLSDADLAGKLSQELGGGSTSKPKA